MGLIDLTGKRFGGVTVIKMDTPKYVPSKSDGIIKKNYWICLCDCGISFSRLAAEIKHYHSCPNCPRKKATSVSKSSSGSKKPLANKNQIRNSWAAMRNRCLSPKNSNFKNYGGRGISICDEWENDFYTFQSWSLDNGYEPGLTIDRINNNGNYEPSNCRWATRKEQHNNRRDNHSYDVDGEKITLANLAERLEIPYDVFYQRVITKKMPLDKAMKLEYKPRYN